MNRFVLVISTLFLLSLGACQPKNKPAGVENTGGQAATRTNLAPVDFQKKYQNTTGAQLVDVRTPQEFMGGFIEGAKNIDIHANDFDAQIAQLDKTKPVFVYCLSGGRSNQAAGKLEAAGFTEIYNLDGGMLNWRNQNMPVAPGLVAPPKSQDMTADDFSKLVSSKEYVLVDFNATWCGPCKMIAPMLEKVAGERKDKLLLAKIDVDQNQSLATSKNIRSIPYLELYQNGKLVWKYVGALDEKTLLKETGL